MFCRNCGTQLQDGANFCGSCGAEQQREASGTAPFTATHASANFTATRYPSEPPKSGNYTAASYPAAAQNPVKGKRISWLMISIALILILLGIGSISLKIVGRGTTAQVTDIEREYIINNDESTRNPNRYKLDYAFSIDGKRYTGSVTRIFKGGSHMRQTIPVRYLPFWPHVNAEDGDSSGLVGSLLLLGLGVLLLVLGVKKKTRV